MRSIWVRANPPASFPSKCCATITLVQAVRSADRKVIGAVFYPEAPALEAKGLKLEVSAPCALVLRETEEACFVTVVDACMDASLKEIALKWNDRDIRIALPQGMYSSKPVTVRIDR